MQIGTETDQDTHYSVLLSNISYNITNEGMEIFTMEHSALSTKLNFAKK